MNEIVLIIDQIITCAFLPLKLQSGIKWTSSSKMFWSIFSGISPPILLQRFWPSSNVLRTSENRICCDLFVGQISSMERSYFVIFTTFVSWIVSQFKRFPWKCSLKEMWNSTVLQNYIFPPPLHSQVVQSEICFSVIDLFHKFKSVISPNAFERVLMIKCWFMYDLTIVILSYSYVVRRFARSRARIK